MHTLQRADQRLGWIACAALQPLRWSRPLRRLAMPRRPSGRVLLMKFWGIGSLQLLTPAVRTLRARHPGSELVLLTLSGNREMAQTLGVFDRVLTLDVNSSSWSVVLTRIARTVAALRRERFDSVYDFEFFTRFSALVTLLTGADDTHGFAASKVWRGSFHRRDVPFNRYWHVARNFRVLAGDEDGRPVAAGDVDALRFEPQDEACVEGLLTAAGLEAGLPYAVLDPNAGSLSLERRWPATRFGELATRLVREDGLSVVLIGSKSEREYTEGVRNWCETDAQSSVVNLAGQLSVQGLAALLARASVVVSNDSGPMHLSAALGAPTIGLFGPETPVMYAPLGAKALPLYKPTPCSPCINVHDNKFSSCMWGHPHCLVNLEVNEVLGAARRLVSGAPYELTPAPRPERPSVPAPLPRRIRRF
jgi:lipopolysaccharide heptosyltransferase II